MCETSSLTAWTKSSWPAIPDVTTANCRQLYLTRITYLLVFHYSVKHDATLSNQKLHCGIWFLFNEPFTDEYNLT